MSGPQADLSPREIDTLLRTMEKVGPHERIGYEDACAHMACSHSEPYHVVRANQRPSLDVYDGVYE